MSSENGRQLPQPVVANHGELSQLSPDGQNVELRVHAVQHMPNGEGMVIGEVVFRTFRGGLGALQHLINAGPEVATRLVVQATSGLVIPG